MRKLNLSIENTYEKVERWNTNLNQSQKKFQFFKPGSRLSRVKTMIKKIFGKNGFSHFSFEWTII